MKKESGGAKRDRRKKVTAVWLARAGALRLAFLQLAKGSQGCPCSESTRGTIGEQAMRKVWTAVPAQIALNLM